MSFIIQVKFTQQAFDKLKESLNDYKQIESYYQIPLKDFEKLIIGLPNYFVLESKYKNLPYLVKSLVNTSTPSAIKFLNNLMRTNGVGWHNSDDLVVSLPSKILTQVKQMCEHTVIYSNVELTKRPSDPSVLDLYLEELKTLPYNLLLNLLTIYENDEQIDRILSFLKLPTNYSRFSFEYILCACLSNNHFKLVPHIIKALNSPILHLKARIMFMVAIARNRIDFAELMLQYMTSDPKITSSFTLPIDASKRVDTDHNKTEALYYMLDLYWSDRLEFSCDMLEILFRWYIEEQEYVCFTILATHFPSYVKTYRDIPPFMTEMIAELIDESLDYSIKWL